MRKRFYKEYFEFLFTDLYRKWYNYLVIENKGLLIYQKFQITLAHNLRSLGACYFEETILMVFQKHTSPCAAMFLAFVPTLSDANSACTKAAKNFNLCLDDKMDQKLLYLNKYPNVDETLLYYLV